MIRQNPKRILEYDVEACPGSSLSQVAPQDLYDVSLKGSLKGD